MTNNRRKIKKTQRLTQVEDSDHQSTLSGASIIGSNDDILTEILLRLPASSILRFKSVSKHWRWLLSDRSFTIRFDKLSKSPGMFVRNEYIPFDVEDRSPPPFRTLDFHPDPHGITILQSCNGLLLCSSDPCSIAATRKYYVFNPTTKQFAIIPPVPGRKAVRETIIFMGLAFHQTDCARYKVICIRALEPGEWLFQIQIYSSDTRKWKISIESFSAHKQTFSKGVYWNGAIHWAPAIENNFYFKIDVEQLHLSAVPTVMVEMTKDELYAVFFGESRGHLHLIVRKYMEPYSLHLNVNEMLSDHSGWFLKYQLELDELPRAFPGMINVIGTYVVIDVVRGEKDEDTFLVLIVAPRKLITYNVHDSSCKEIFTYPEYYHYVNTIFHRYTEALTSF